MESCGQANDRIRWTSKHLGEVFGGFITLLIFNLYIFWKPLTAGVVTDSWYRILWAVNMATVIQIVGHTALIFVRRKWFRKISKTVFNLASILSLAVFLSVFPVDFSKINLPWLNMLLRIILSIALFGTAIAALVNFIKFLKALVLSEE